MAIQKIIQAGPESDQGLESTAPKAKAFDPGFAPTQHVEKNKVDREKDHMNYDRIDKEVAKYANEVAINISPAENSRLRRLVDKRVLSVMIFTYFLQALDRGTIGFASIMGIIHDTHLVGQQVCFILLRILL